MALSLLAEAGMIQVSKGREPADPIQPTAFRPRSSVAMMAFPR